MSIQPVLLPLLSPVPGTLSLLEERLQDLGYAFFDASSLEGIAAASFAVAPELGLVPLTNQSSLVEVAQRISALREKYPEMQMIGVYSGKLSFKIPECYRAGVNALFQSPFEEELLINKLFELWPVDVGTKDLTLDQLMRVNIVDMENTEKLEFDVFVYLPMNRKAILYLEHERKIDDRVIRKFKTNAHYNLYIRRSDVKKYLRYCGAVLRSGSKTMPEKLGEVMSGFFNDENLSEDESKSMLANLKSLTEQLEDGSGSKKDLVKSVSRFASQQMTHYSHAQNVAAYSCLFGLALGINEPETLRMGGLLHDLGLSDLPPSLVGRELADLSEEDAAKYKLHPGGGKYSVEEKKLAVPSAAMDMILYHHERPDGSGYPYGKKGDEIPPAAKVCAFADEFDKLTSVRPGYKQLSPMEAVQRIAGLDGKPPMSLYDPQFHKPLIDLFLKASTEKSEGTPSERSKTASRTPPVFTPKIPSGPVVTVASLMATPKFAHLPEFSGVSEELASNKLFDELRAQLKAHFDAVSSPI